MSEGSRAVVSTGGAEERIGGVLVRTLLDTGAGRDGLVRRRVEVPPGSRVQAVAGPGGGLWYAMAGHGVVTSGTGPEMPIRRDTALWLPPGTRCHLAAGAAEPLTLDSVTLPAGPVTADGTAPDDTAARSTAADSAAQALGGAAGPRSSGEAAEPRLSELGDCAVEVTGDRRFRVLFGPGNGCAAATQFVGEIPPGRAPLHSHTYDEVVLVLEGDGLLHAGRVEHPIAAGTCVHLPPGQQHCLENTGRSTLRVLGVFHPGGSPAAKTSAS
jgi:mannose-6-phosphate isomerase-like protein (cupin superfamily)